MRRSRPGRRRRWARAAHPAPAAQAKAAVEDAPTVLKENIPKEDADAIVEKLKAVGAECELE